MTTMIRVARTAAVMVVVTGLPGNASAQPSSPNAGGYLVPPDRIVEILDAPPTPRVLVGPARDVAVFIESRSMPPIAWLARPMHRLAGYRIDPRNSGPWSSARDCGADGPFASPPPAWRMATRTPAAGPAAAATLATACFAHRRAGTEPLWGGRAFSPDGSHRLLRGPARHRDRAVGRRPLYAVSLARSRAPALNATWGNPCEWLADNSRASCAASADVGARGVPPAIRRAQPAGPNVQEHDWRAGARSGPIRIC